MHVQVTCGFALDLRGFNVILTCAFAVVSGQILNEFVAYSELIQLWVCAVTIPH